MYFVKFILTCTLNYVIVWLYYVIVVEILNQQYIIQIEPNSIFVSFHSYPNMTQITSIVGMQCVHINYVKILSATVL